jgi:hypothetical protein
LSIVKEMRAKQQPPEHRNLLLMLSASTAVVIAAIVGALVTFVDHTPAKPNVAAATSGSSSVFSRTAGGNGNVMFNPMLTPALNACELGYFTDARQQEMCRKANEAMRTIGSIDQMRRMESLLTR